MVGFYFVFICYCLLLPAIFDGLLFWDAGDL